MERYVMIFAASELGSINFDEVVEDSAESVRFSVDHSKALVKWDSDSASNVPPSVNSLATKEGPYDLPTALGILSSTFWSGTE